MYAETTIGSLLKETSEPIHQLARQYLYYMENVRDFSLETVKSRRTYLKEYSSYFEEWDISEITNKQIDEYFVHLKTRISSLTKQPISYGSLNNRKRAVRVFLRWCRDTQEIPIKVKLDEIHIKREPDTHKKHLSLEDILYVISRVTDPEDKLIIRLAFEAGLRISELKSVEIDHLRGTKLIVIGKGDKERTTFVSLSLAEDLHGWSMGKPGPLFDYHTDTLRQRIKRWFKKVLGVDMHPHDLRHAFALMLLKGGCNIRAIQKLLGHANIETTMIYLGVDDDWLEKEYLSSTTTTKK